MLCNLCKIHGRQSPAIVQPAIVTNPFGNLPPTPQISIGQAQPAIQYGISSLPVADKVAPVRISSLLTTRHYSQGRVRFPARKYHPKTEGIKVPFFSEDEEISSFPKADAFFIARENPRALIISPTDTWPSRTRSGISSSNKSLGKESNEVSEEGKATTKCENGAEIEAILPKLQLSDSYTEPSIQEMAARERSQPGFLNKVEDFVVGRHGYGSIKFPGETDVRELNLDAIIRFDKREVIVYRDETKKHPIGEGLNKQAEISLLNVKCIDKKTGLEYTQGPKKDEFEELLKRKTVDQGATFTSYDPINGEWKFMVNHFGRSSV